MNKTLSLILAATACALSTWPTVALAQAWPTKQPIRLVAVFPPGGSVDQVARVLQVPLQQALGQTVIVENKGGASGSIGTASVAAAPADGYTFAVVFDTHGVNPALQPNLPFDTKRDLTAVSLIGTGSMVLATTASSDYKTFGDVIAAAKAGKNVAYGSIGAGSLGHLAMVLMAKSDKPGDKPADKLDITHVPYRGGGPLMNDVLGGSVQLSIGSVFLTKPHIDSGRLRALAVTTSQRSANLPNVPTIAESGYAGFNAPAWWAVLAPAKTPPEILKRMHDEITTILKSPDVRTKLSAQGIDIAAMSADEANAYIGRQIDTWAKVVKDNNIKAE